MQKLAQPRPATAERLGLKGYDPVAYFTLGMATPGVAAYEFVWDGVRYRVLKGANRVAKTVQLVRPR